MIKTIPGNPQEWLSVYAFFVQLLFKFTSGPQGVVTLALIAPDSKVDIIWSGDRRKYETSQVIKLIAPPERSNIRHLRQKHAVPAKRKSTGLSQLKALASK